MDSQHADDGATRSPPTRRYAWLWLPVVFVVGLLAGGVIVAVFSDGTSAHPATPRPTVTVTQSPPNTGSRARVLVGPACLKAVNDAQSAYSLLAKVGAAIRGLDPGALGRLAQQAQSVERRIQHDLRGCHATVQAPGSGAAPTPTS